MKRFFRGIGALAVALALVVALMGTANALTRTIGNYIVSNNAGWATQAEWQYACNVVLSQGALAYNAAASTTGGPLSRITIEVYGPSSGLSGNQSYLACLVNPGAKDNFGNGNRMDLFLETAALTSAQYTTYGGAIAAMTTEILFFNRTQWTNAQLNALTADAAAPTAFDSGQGRLSYIVNGLAEYVKNCVYAGGRKLDKTGILLEYNKEIAQEFAAARAGFAATTSAFAVDNSALGASTLNGGVGDTGWLGAGDGYRSDVVNGIAANDYMNFVGAGTLGFGDLPIGFGAATAADSAALEVVRLTALGFFVANATATTVARNASGFVGQLATGAFQVIPGNLTPWTGVYLNGHIPFVKNLGEFSDSNVWPAWTVWNTFDRVFGYYKVVNGAFVDAAAPTTFTPPGFSAMWDNSATNTVANVNPGAPYGGNPFSTQYDQFWYSRNQF